MADLAAPKSTRAGPALCWAVCGLGWLAGCGLQLQMATLWPWASWAWLTGLGLLLWPLAGWGRARGWGLLLCLLAAMVLGWSATHLRAQWRLQEVLSLALEGQDLQLVGTVASLPQESLEGTRFVFEVASARHQGHPVVVPRQVALGWYRGFDDDALLGGPPEPVRAGQRWQLTARLKQPHGSLNPHGFDLELRLFEQGVRASGSVRSRPGDVARRIEDRAGHGLQRARQDWRDAIQARVQPPAVAGVLAALAMGDQAAIERDDWDLFRVTGVAHLMSISGLHITMLAWVAALLVGWLWRWHPRAPLAVPAPVAARWGGLLVALAYALLAGWGVPAQRTVWMIAAVVVLRQAGLRWPLVAVMLAAAVVVTVLDPWALLQPGFWLSFVAVSLLVVSEPVHSPQPKAATTLQRAAAAARSGLRSQWVATLGLAPLSLIFFQQISVVGMVANLLAIPVVTLVVTPLALMGVVVPPLWDLAAMALAGLMALLKLLGAMPGATWSAAVAPPWAVACGLLAGALAVLPLPWRLRVLALPLLLPLLLPPVSRPVHGEFEVVAADVGQGTAVLVRTATHLLVYDTGPQYSPQADAGTRVLLPLLRARGEPRVDLLMLSHRDLDHVGGAAALLRSMPVLALSSSLEEGHPLISTGRVPHQRCLAGQRWVWDGVQFEVLHPVPADFAGTPRSNALSCVLRVSGSAAGPSSLLLTGDIEAAQEAALVTRAGPALRSDVLLVPHHGSRTSSTAVFLDAVAPQVAVVQAAYRSRYGHPASDVLARYEQRGVQVSRTDRCGAWLLTPGAEAGLPPQAQCTRQLRQRYWHYRHDRHDLQGRHHRALPD